MMVAEKRKLQKKVVVKSEVAVKKTKVKLPESDSQRIIGRVADFEKLATLL